MRPFAAKVAVWKGFVPKTNSGWIIIDKGQVTIIDAKKRVLGVAPVEHVRFAKTRFAAGAVTVRLEGQRFLLSQGGSVGSPGLFDDIPDMGALASSAYEIEAALLAAGATPSGKTRAT